MLKNKKFFIVLSVIAALIAAGIIFIFWMSRDSRSDKGDVQTKETQSKEVYTQDLPSTYSKDRIDSYVVDDGNESYSIKPKRDDLSALFVINHINWIVTKIKNYNDPIVLEEEYKNICADSLNLNSIKDPETIDLISDIMDAITEMRIDEKEREMLKEELDQGMSDAMYDALSGINAGGGLSPIGAVFNLVTSAVTAGANYKRAKKRVMQTYKKQTWGLDKSRMQNLNELNKSLLQKYWILVQRYSLPDEYRVSENDIAMLIDHLKDENPNRLHSFLKSMEKKYFGLQNYWYYRALTATQVKDKDDAKKALDEYIRFQRDYGQILRIDGIAAKAAMLRIKLMMDDGKIDVPKCRELLKVIERNSTIDEWQSYYFCAMVYADELGDIASAERVLLPVTTRLDFKRHNRLVEWCNQAQEKKDLNLTNSVDRLIPSGDALYECKTLLLGLSKYKLTATERDRIYSAICDDAGASAKEKLFLYCSLRYEDALKKIIPDLKNIRVICEQSSNPNNLFLKLSMPMSWEISCNGGSALCLLKNVDLSTNVNVFEFIEQECKGNEEHSIEEREDGLNCAVIDFGEQECKDKKIGYLVRYDKGKSSSLMVALVFESIEEGKNMLKPVRAYLGPWHIAEGVKKDDQSYWCNKPETKTPDVTIVDLTKE